MSAAIFNSGTVKILKDILKFKSGNQITQAGTVNPTAISTAGMPGDLYISATTGAVYKKLDSGSSVNWKELLDSATVAAIVASYIPLSQKGAANGVVPLDGGMKIDISYLPSSLLIYKGQWNALTNTPSLADASGTSGWVYETSVAGTQNLGSGSQTFKIGDWVVYDGTKWDISTNSNEVVSVNGMSGAITLTSTNINEGANLYFTDERAQDAIGAALVNTSTVNLVYDDAANQITANVVAGSISSTQLAGNIDATKIADGTVTSIEFQYINSLTSNAQTQIDARANNTLSNLVASTGLNVDLLPLVSVTGASLGSSLRRFKDIWSSGIIVTNQVLQVVGGLKIQNYKISTDGTADVTLNLNSASVRAPILLDTGNALGGTDNSSAINLVTGNTTAGNTGNSGAITLTTGVAETGTRGKVILNGSSVDVSSKKIVNVDTPTVDTDATNKLYVDTKVAALGVTNFVTNGSAENNVTGWLVDSFAAATRPSGALSGVATGVTFAQSAVSPLAGTNSFLFSKDAVNRQGRVVYTGLTITPAYFAKVLSVTADYQVASGTFVAGTSSADSDVIFYLQDVTNGTFIEPSSFKLLSNSTTISDKFQATFQTSATGTSYRLMMYVASTSAVAYALRFDNIAVSPSVYVFGTPVTDWVPYSLVITGTTTNPTKVASPARDSARWRRVGDSMEINYSYYQTTGGTAGSGTYLYSLPSGFTIDTSKMFVAVDGHQTNCGSASFYAAGIPFTGHVFAATTTNLGIQGLNDTLASVMVSSTRAPLSAEVLYNFSARVPILGWSSSVQMSDSADTRVCAAAGKFGTLSLTTSLQTLPLSTVSKDTHGMVSGNTLVIKVPGIYLILGRMDVSCTNDMYFTSLLNGSALGSSYTSGAGFKPATLNDEVELKAGDIISFNTQTGSGTGSMAGVGYTSWSVTRLSGPSAIAASETISASYLNTSGQSIPSATMTQVTNWTKEDDTHGMVNATTGVATIPANGRYAITFANSYTNQVTSTNTQLRILKNGTDTSVNLLRYTFVSSTMNINDTQTVSAGSVPLLSGDTIRFIVFHAASGAQPLWTGVSSVNFSIRRVG